MEKRDIDADYKAAYLAEYELLKSLGRHESAERVAAVLRDHYGHEVAPKPKRQRKERADVKAPENTAEQRPQHRGARDAQ